MKKTLFFILTMCAFCIAVHAQSFQFLHFSIKEGLPHPNTYSIIQDANGYIWISTTQGITRFDGIKFTSRFLGDTLPSSIASSIFLDSKSRLWFGHGDGKISLFENNTFKVFNQKGIDKSIIVGFVEDSEGNILAMTQRNGLITFDKDLNIHYVSEPFEGIRVSKFLLNDEGNLLIGSIEGLTLFCSVNGSIDFEKTGRIKDLPFSQVKALIKGKEKNTYLVGTDEEGLYAVRGSGNDPAEFKVSKLGDEQGLQYSIVNALMLDNNGYLWVSDFGVGVYRFKITDLNKLTDKFLFDTRGGLPQEYIEDIFKDDEGDVWFASNSNGIAVLRDQAFTFYEQVNGVDVPEITSMSMIGTDYWFGSKEGKIFYSNPTEPGKTKTFTTLNGLPRERITALWQDNNGDLYIGSESSGVFMLNKGYSRVKKYFVAENSLGNSINAIDGDTRSVWIATNDGIYKKDKIDNRIEHQSTITGLPHNLINDVLVDREGNTWIATRGNGIFCVSDDNPDTDITIVGNPNLEFVDLTEDEKGQIWAASAEDGVFNFAKDSLMVYSLNNGLKSKYTYAIAIDPKGFVWVGHRLGLSRIDPETGNIVVYDQDMGFTSDILHRSIGVNDEGKVLFGTNEGLIVYDVNQAQPDTLVPRLNITELNISDSIYDASHDIHLPFGVYKINIDFIGINLSNPEQVTYRYKLDGFDDWSEQTRETKAKYSRIEDGNYTFMLSACDGNGNCTGDVAMLNISIKIPIWKAWWFIVSLFIIAIAVVFFIIKLRERNQKAMQEYLEKQLDERTREVIHQKEEIEIKNRDITDSINYAQRIQASILPPIQRLHNTFSGSFVFYQPRDIVSGDFYWYDQLDEERFLIVCADSTGHGVPGAFMSMIGTTLIKDICLRDNVKTPSDVLMTLDLEVRDALNQNKETDGSNDGMDIIVAEINLSTNKFIVSSAMRPIILYKDGEQIYVKGSRSSVGGQLEDENMNKEFTNEEFQLSKGDIVYMFSDGYPDQFGGPLGRKFKMVRLKNLLRDIHEKSMEEQYNYVKSNFQLWKEDLEQVDDVLFMGIKI